MCALPRAMLRPRSAAHTPTPPDYHYEPKTGNYYPVVWINTFWTLDESYYPINETLTCACARDVGAHTLMCPRPQRTAPALGPVGHLVLQVGNAGAI